MDGTLYMVYMPIFLRNYKLLLTTFKTLLMLILNVIDNGLVCDCGDSRGFVFDISLILQEIFYLKMGCT